MTIVKQPCVYILASRKYGTLYVGVTSNLAARVSQHRDGEGSEFTKKYGVKRLVWFELHGTMLQAIKRENALKNLKRAEKLILVERTNPEWHDLFETILDR